MIEEWKTRTSLLIGEEGINKLKESKVAVYGIGGVGSFVVEGLVRAGIEKIALIDNDIVDITNINRQIHANINTVGKRKVDVMKQRILEINPKAIVDVYMSDEIANGEENLIDNTFSYVVDTVDTVTTKIKLVEKANKEDVKIISCMGTGNKMEPTKLEISDIYKTPICPLARVIRKELKTRGIKKLKVLYSKEEPIKSKNVTFKENTIKTIPGSISFVPSVAGLIIAGEVIKDIIK